MKIYLTNMQLPSIDNYKVVKQKGGVRCEFHVAVEEVQKTITDQKWAFPRWCRHLKGIPPSEIHSMLSTARGSRNVGATFNWLIKEYKYDKSNKHNQSFSQRHC